jgi:hypothetical protein
VSICICLEREFAGKSLFHKQCSPTKLVLCMYGSRSVVASAMCGSQRRSVRSYLHTPGHRCRPGAWKIVTWLGMEIPDLKKPTSFLNQNSPGSSQKVRWPNWPKCRCRHPLNSVSVANLVKPPANLCLIGNTSKYKMVNDSWNCGSRGNEASLWSVCCHLHWFSLHYEVRYEGLADYFCPDFRDLLRGCYKVRDSLRDFAAE